MPSIDIPLLIVGHGPGAVVAAKVVSGQGLPCLIAGHESLNDLEPVVLDDESLAILEPNGVLGVLRPYAAAQDPFTIAPHFFEDGLKHHCVADMLITVFDGMSFESGQFEDSAVGGVLTDGRTRWDLHADAFLDVGTLSTELNETIAQAAAFSTELLADLAAVRVRE